MNTSTMFRPKLPVLAIAASTGGPQALAFLLSQFQNKVPATLVVQHMPVGFTKGFANYLNRFLPYEVKEAEDGDEIRPGRVLIAPAGFHMEVSGSFIQQKVILQERPALHGVRPAADYLFHSIADMYGSNSVGVILTGMGKDGARGLEAMKKTGSFNIAQDEKSCVVYGMPKVAANLGAVDAVM